MIGSLFTIYFLAMLAIFAKKRNLAFAFIILGLLFIAYILWYYSTDTLGIRL